MIAFDGFAGNFSPANHVETPNEPLWSMRSFG